jgi:RHS repeat-associated protein
LTGASGTLNGANYSVSYSYDLNGNRTMAGYQTGTGNELLSDGTYKYTYDNDGNLVSQTNIATGYVTYYTWDYRNRLVEVKQETSTGTVINDEKFTYDVNNNRISVSLNGTPQLYTVYDGANPYLDFNGNGQLTERYLTNPNVLSQFYGQVDANGNTQWFLTDNLGSVREVVDNGGSVLDAIVYDPYGNILSQTNAANAPRFLYAGGAYDSLTGYDQFGRRYYDPSDGRWTSQDPLGFKAGDGNLYRYVGNDPTDAVDPLGLWKYKWPWEKDASWSFEGSLIYDVIDIGLEPIRMGGDLMRAGQAGINNATGGTPYVPEWHSNLARNAPPPADKEANLEYLKQAELDNLEDGAIAIGTMGVVKGGGKVIRKVVGRGTAAGTAAPKGTRCPAPQNPSRGVPDPSTPVGRSGNPLGSVAPNQPTTIGGRPFSGHAIDQMQARGIPPSVVENTIQHGRPFPGNTPGTTGYYDPVNNVRVITNSTTGSNRSRVEQHEIKGFLQSRGPF